MATNPTTQGPVAPQPVVIKVEGSGGGPWPILLLSVVVAIVVPISVGKMNQDASHEGIDKDYVGLAVNILNAKGSPPESRQWALNVLNKLSPVPFTREGVQDLKAGNPLYSTVSGAVAEPLYGPTHPFIKKGAEPVQPCKSVPLPPGKTINDDQILDFAVRLSEAYEECALKQSYAVQMIDILQHTNKTPQAIHEKTPKMHVLEVKP
ncbi:hypothetical protein EUV02_03860 [Polymorphobacter arshaanensis]|uniref:Uncharacterized protein n=1 Tax=Glacieibacterium arshaanense TaxID=2511025 RepID=A0A4Y9ETB3_9SPHN|nr:hypothetical protein [Polymorphobacter arshaanensis]TFU06158.1 hypothetical protein EUV02_03860 [Polymorphobacter arshaanensis]